jgi:hypothetical protein
MVSRMKNRTATWIHLIFASIVVIGVPVQVYLIASYFTGAGSGALDAHEFTGGIVIHISEVIVFLSSLVAFWGVWRWVAWSLALPVLGTVQIALVNTGDSGWVNGLHGLGALLVFLLAAYLAYNDLRLLGLYGRPAAAGAPPQPPPPA